MPPIGCVLPRVRQHLADTGGWLAPAVAFLLPLGTYLTTMARGLVWGDGIELATVSATLGIAHPTGYPLFTIVGHLFTHLPFGSVISRMTFFCALSVAGSSCLLYGLLLRWIRWQPRLSPGFSPRALALAGALTFAWSLGPWSHATVTEVYAFQLMIQLTALDLAFRALHEESRWALSLLALTLGLGMTHHMLTLALFPFLIAAVLFWVGRLRLEPWVGKFRLVAGLAGLFLLGLLPLLYVPLRASQAPRLSWGDPSNLERWFQTLRGGSYLEERFLRQQPGILFDWASLGDHLTGRLFDLTDYLVGQIVSAQVRSVEIGLLLLAVGTVLFGLGMHRIFRRQRAYAVAWTAALGLYLFVLLTYNIRDIADYQLGFFGLVWPVFWLGLVETARYSSRPPPSWSEGVPRRSLNWVVLMLPLTLLIANFRTADRSHSDLADAYASRLLASLPRDAILLTDGDYSTASAWYQQEVEGQRGDVLVYCLNFLAQPWYLAYFERRDLRGRQVGVASRRPEDNEAFLSELDRLIIAPNVAEFPIFMTPSPVQLRQLRQHFRVEYAGHLMSDREYGEALAGAVVPPQPLLFRIH